MKMHSSYKICAVTWIVKKKHVTLISTNAQSIPKEDNKGIVPRCVGGQKVEIPTSSVHLEYTTYMRDVDIADQL